MAVGTDSHAFWARSLTCQQIRLDPSGSCGENRAGFDRSSRDFGSEVVIRPLFAREHLEGVHFGGCTTGPGLVRSLGNQRGFRPDDAVTSVDAVRISEWSSGNAVHVPTVTVCFGNEACWKAVPPARDTLRCGSWGAERLRLHQHGLGTLSEYRRSPSGGGRNAEKVWD